jgi:hypothetical protein
MALRSEPAPLSAVLVTVRVAACADQAPKHRKAPALKKLIARYAGKIEYAPGYLPLSSSLVGSAFQAAAGLRPGVDADWKVGGSVENP